MTNYPAKQDRRNENAAWKAARKLTPNPSLPRASEFGQD